MVAARDGPPEAIGKEEEAFMMICECEGEEWNIFALNRLPEHLHFQCKTCNISYCDGICDLKPS